MPSLLSALFAFLALAGEVISISVPTGKETPITPARVTPRPTYRPPTAQPAPVVEYSLDNPEPEPLDPSWAFVPVKYLNVLTANSIRYVPMTIRNPYPYLHKDNADQVVDQVYNYNYGAKIMKEKYKPRYYHPKFAQTYKVPTKGGYPKKAISDMKYYYFQKSQPVQQVTHQQIQDAPQQQFQQIPQVQQQIPQVVPQQQIQQVIPQQQIPQAVPQQEIPQAVPQQQIQQVPEQEYQQQQQEYQQQQQQEYQQQHFDQEQSQ